MGELALRARSFGLERRARQLEWEQRRQHSRARGAVWAQLSTAVHLRAIAALDPDYDEEEQEYGDEGSYLDGGGDGGGHPLSAGGRGSHSGAAAAGGAFDFERARSWDPRPPSPHLPKAVSSNSMLAMDSVGGPPSTPPRSPYQRLSLGEDQEAGKKGFGVVDDPEAGGGEVDGHGPPMRGGGSTLTETVLAILKSTIGPGLLYVPKGFQEAGLLFAVPMMLLSTLLFSNGALRVLEAWARHRRSAARMMGLAFGRFGEGVVHAAVFCQQCGICLTYFIFVATNAQALAADLFGVEDLSMVHLCYWQLLLFLPLVMIRDIENFTYTNMVANVAILYSVLVLCAFAAAKVLAGPCPGATPMGTFDCSEDGVSINQAIGQSVSQSVSQSVGD